MPVAALLSTRESVDRAWESCTGASSRVRLEASVGQTGVSRARAASPPVSGLHPQQRTRLHDDQEALTPPKSTKLSPVKRGASGVGSV